MSASQIAAQLQARRGRAAGRESTRISCAEVEAALVVRRGACRTARQARCGCAPTGSFVAAGSFHRCVNPACGKLYPMGEEKLPVRPPATAPLYLCRNCGADYLRLVGDPEGVRCARARSTDDGPEWMLYEPARFDGVFDAEEEDERKTKAEAGAGQGAAGGDRAPSRSRAAPCWAVRSIPRPWPFQHEAGRLRARRSCSRPRGPRCLCCGGTAGSRNVITPVALGTSAAVKVVGEGLVEALAEANRGDRPRRQGTPADLQRQPPGRRPPGPLHHLRQPLRPDAPPLGRSPQQQSGC